MLTIYFSWSAMLFICLKIIRGGGKGGCFVFFISRNKFYIIFGFRVHGIRVKSGFLEVLNTVLTSCQCTSYSCDWYIFKILHDCEHIQVNLKIFFPKLNIFYETLETELIYTMASLLVLRFIVEKVE